MAFDLKTARPVESSGFDLSTAKPVNEDTPQKTYTKQEIFSNPELFEKFKKEGERLAESYGFGGGDFPELISTLATSAKFAGSKTPIGALAVGGAAAGGELIKQAGQKLDLIQGEPPQTLKESGKRVLGAVGRNILGETVARGASGLIGRSPSFTPEIEAQAKTFQEATGAKPPLGTMTESKGTQVLERMAEFNPFGAKVTEMRKKAVDGLAKFAEKVGDKIKSKLPPEVSGALIKEDVQGFFDKFHQTTDAIYNPLMNQISRIPAQLDNTVNKLQEILTNRSGVGEPSKLNEVRAWLSDLLGKKIPSKLVDKDGKPIMKEVSGLINDFEGLKKFRTNIAQMTKFDDASLSGIKSDLIGLYGAISEDMNNTVKGFSEDAYNELLRANEVYQKGKQVLGSKLFKSLASVPQDTIHKIVINPKSSILIKEVKEILPKDTFETAKRAWMDDLISNSFIKNEGENVLSPAKLLSNINKYKNVIGEIFSGNPDQLKMFKDLEDSALLLTRGKQVQQGSQTAFNQSALIQAIIPVVSSFVSGVASGQPVLGTLGGFAAGMAGSKALTNIVVSDFGREFLTRGFPKTALALSTGIKTLANLGLKEKNFIKENQ